MYSTCETLAAIVVHIRKLTSKGLKLTGGADTFALCGASVLWDTKIPLQAATCSECKNLFENKIVT